MANVIKHVISIISVVIITTADIVLTVSRSCCNCGKDAPRNAAESEPLAQAEPLADDGRVAGLPLRGEEGEEGLTRDAEQRRLAQTPHGSLLDLIHEFGKILVERAEGVNHEGRERCINGFRVGIVFEVLGAPSPLDGLARCGRGEEMGRGKRVDSCHVDGHHFPREDKLAVGDARAHVLGLEA